MNKLKISLFAVLLISLSTQAMADDALRDTIQAREDQWSAAFNANDSAALGAIYELDARLIPPGAAPSEGRAAIAEALAGLFPAMQDLQLVTDEVTALGSAHAVEIGRAVYDAVSEDGTLTPTTNNYVVVWQKGEDGVWRYLTDIFN